MALIIGLIFVFAYGSLFLRFGGMVQKDYADDICGDGSLLGRVIAAIYVIRFYLRGMLIIHIFRTLFTIIC